MKHIRFLALAVTVFVAFVGCELAPHNIVKDAKQENDLEKEGNRLTDEANGQADFLKNTYQLDLRSLPIFGFNFDWAKLNGDQRADVRKRLNTYMGTIDRINEISRHKNVTLKGESLAVKLNYSRAKSYLESLDAYEKDPAGYRVSNSIFVFPKPVEVKLDGTWAFLADQAQSDLKEKYKIDLSKSISNELEANRFDWNSLNPDDRKLAENRLNTLVIYADTYLKGSNTNKDREAYSILKQNAERFLKSLKTFKSSIQI